MTGSYEDRAYQQEVVSKARKAIQDGNRKILIQAATGSGKTVMASEIISGAHAKGNRLVFLAHRRELVYQSYDKLMDYGIRPGIIMSGEYGESSSFVQVASIDTLRARVKRNQIMLPHADIVFIDEAHRSLAPTYLKLIREYEEKGAVIIGLTATPVRADGHGLGQIYEAMVCAPSVKELISMGYLVQPKYYAPSVPDLVGVEIQAGDYKQAQLAARMDRSELIGDIVTNWMRIADGKKTVVFASSVEHSIHLRDEFKKFGVSAEHIDGHTPLDERDRIIGDLRNGKIRVICNCMVLTEGFDCPDLEVCVLARPTRNLGLYLQMGGRVLRPAEGKEYATIIDHSGAIYRHGFLEDDIKWDLDPGVLFEDREHGMTRTPTKEPITCVNCGHVYSGEIVCPECKHKPQKQGRWHETRAADLMPVSKDERVAQQRLFELDEHRDWYGMFKQHAIDQGFKPGWAFHKFKEKFKENPSPAVQKALPKPTTREFRAWIRSRQIAWAAVKRREEQRMEQEMKDRIRSQRG